MNVDAAVEYADRRGPHALVVWRDGETLVESYAGGYDAQKPHALYSGTKSFWGVLAVAAQADGLLSLDERVADTFPAWEADALRARVKLRHLLTLTSGIGFGGLGNAVPPYEKALAVEVKAAPGTRFTYGGIPLQVFGAVLAAKLAPRGLTPHAFLHERVLDRAGVAVARWRTLTDGTQPLPTGAFLTAQAWLRYGRFVLAGGTWDGDAVVERTALETCFKGTRANSRYGLGWWLSPLAAHPDVAYASGSGGQAMYVIPSANAVVVRFGDGSSWKHDTFLKRLLG